MPQLKSETWCGGCNRKVLMRVAKKSKRMHISFACYNKINKKFACMYYNSNLLKDYIETYTQMTLLLSLHVAWIQAHALNKVWCQLWSTFHRSSKLCHSAYNTSLVATVLAFSTNNLHKLTKLDTTKCT